MWRGRDYNSPAAAAKLAPRGECGLWSRHLNPRAETSWAHETFRAFRLYSQICSGSHFPQRMNLGIFHPWWVMAPRTTIPWDNFRVSHFSRSGSAPAADDLYCWVEPRCSIATKTEATTLASGPAREMSEGLSSHSFALDSDRLIVDDDHRWWIRMVAFIHPSKSWTTHDIVMNTPCCLLQLLKSAFITISYVEEYISLTSTAVQS